MNSTMMSQTWSSNGNATPLQSVNTTLDDILPPKDPKMSSLDWEAEKKAIYIIEIILHCMFLVVGLFGNVFTIAVLVFKKWTNITSRHILIALAVSDSTMLFSHTFNQDFLKDLLKLDARGFSNIGCKMFYIFYRTSKLTSSWFVLFLCFERFVAVTFPLKVKTIITNQRTKGYIIVTYLIMTSFAIGLSFSSATEGNTCKKDVVTSDMKPVFQALALCEMLLYSVLPIILMSALTPIIVVKLFKRYQAKKKITSKTEAGREREKQQLKEMIRTTTILISVVAAFIICVAPMTVFQQVKFWSGIKKKEIEITYSLYIFREVSQRFEQVNYSINFFLYIFTSSSFRKTVFEMLHIKPKREGTSSNGSTKLTKIEQSKEKRSALSSTSGSSYNGEMIGIQSACDQLESNREDKPQEEMSEKVTQIPISTTIQNSGQENNLTEKVSTTENIIGTVIHSSTVQNDDHMSPICTDDDITENKVPQNDNLELFYKDEQST